MKLMNTAYIEVVVSPLSVNDGNEDDPKWNELYDLDSTEFCVVV